MPLSAPPAVSASSKIEVGPLDVNQTLTEAETVELLEADRQMGKSLGRLIVSLGASDDQLDSMLSQVGVSFITPYTLACNTWQIPLE